jgi:hypothetical protein
MRFSFTLAAIAVCFAVSMSAHHSHGQYAETFSDMTGIVKEIHLVQPHSWIYMEVKDAKGTPALWAVEATGRDGLARIGVERGYLKAGDQVKVRCHPLRDGTNGCLLGFLKSPTGDVKNWDGGAAPQLSDF